MIVPHIDHYPYFNDQYVANKLAEIERSIAALQQRDHRRRRPDWIRMDFVHPWGAVGTPSGGPHGHAPQSHGRSVLADVVESVLSQIPGGLVASTASALAAMATHYIQRALSGAGIPGAMDRAAPVPAIPGHGHPFVAVPPATKIEVPTDPDGNRPWSDFVGQTEARLREKHGARWAENVEFRDWKEIADQNATIKNDSEKLKKENDELSRRIADLSSSFGEAIHVMARIANGADAQEAAKWLDGFRRNGTSQAANDVAEGAAEADSLGTLPPMRQIPT